MQRKRVSRSVTTIPIIIDLLGQNAPLVNSLSLCVSSSCLEAFLLHRGVLWGVGSGVVWTLAGKRPASTSPAFLLLVGILCLSSAMSDSLKLSFTVVKGKCKGSYLSQWSRGEMAARESSCTENITNESGCHSSLHSPWHLSQLWR